MTSHRNSFAHGERVPIALWVVPARDSEPATHRCATRVQSDSKVCEGNARLRHARESGVGLLSRIRPSSVVRISCRCVPPGPGFSLSYVVYALAEGEDVNSHLVVSDTGRFVEMPRSSAVALRADAARAGTYAVLELRVYV
jgi:hypothetical protein